MNLFPNQTRLAVLQVLMNEDLPTLGVIDAVAKLTRGKIRITESSVYTTLHRMESAGLIRGEYRDQDLGRRRGHPRRYYRITGAGQRHLTRVHEFREVGWSAI